MNQIDTVSRQTRFSLVHPMEKAALLLICLLIVGCWRTPIAGLFVACAALFYLIVAQASIRFYLTLLTAPLLFITMGIVPIAFSFDGWLKIAFSEKSINDAVLTASAAFGGACALYAFILTTPFSQTAWLMKKSRISPLFIDIAVLVYRFIFQLSERKTVIWQAQLLRGGCPGIQMAAQTAVHTFTSTMLEMETRQQAAELRGGLDYFAVADWSSFWRKKK
ncbi:energy-coupling factor transporter transmembrane component T family protein [Domibacillus tundrae]|uniref:energy-coupling factor transporter transmembrane component T family protein n=1 Tax=Domibacillus tundrae TaxID=1587527 RepID=UPI000617EFDA|nr:energy-coupling factor transporter transmembrane component T [Domibacillus tundrae]